MAEFNITLDNRVVRLVLSGAAGTAHPTYKFVIGSKLPDSGKPSDVFASFRSTDKVALPICDSLEELTEALRKLPTDARINVSLPTLRIGVTLSRSIRPVYSASGLADLLERIADKETSLTVAERKELAARIAAEELAAQNATVPTALPVDPTDSATEPASNGRGRRKASAAA